MIRKIFEVVADSLSYIGSITGLTYNEINILVYYLLIPLSWAVMFDVWLGKPIATSITTVVWITIFIVTRNSFSQWCDKVFQDSVDFLNWFNCLGGNYILNSVIICVLLPLIVYGVLIWLLVR